MADELNILVKAILDAKDLQAQADSGKGITIPGRIVIDTKDLKEQINSVVGETSKFGNKFKIKYGVDKGDFVKQFRVAGEAAKKELEKTISSSGGVKVAPIFDTDALGILRKELSSIGFDNDSIKKATANLEKQKITVGEIVTSYQDIAEAQKGSQLITLKGVDSLKRQVALSQQFNAELGKLETPQVKFTAKINEQGEVINKMATKLQPKDTATIKAGEAEILNRFVSNLQKANQYTGEMRETAESLRVSLQNAFSNQEITTYRNQLDIAQEKFRALQAEAARVAALPTTKVDNNVSSLNTSLAYQGMDAQTSGISNLRNEINSLISEYGRLKVSMDGLDPNSAEFQALGVQVDALDARFKSATKAAELFNGTVSNKTKLAGIDDQIRKAKTSLEELESKWSKFKGNPALLKEFKELQHAAQQLDATNLQNFNKQLASFKTNVRAAGADTRKFGDELKNALAKFGLWITASSIFMQAWRGMRQMIDSVKQLDAALVEFNKVADLSSSQLDKFINRAFEAGEALGRTGTEVIQATAIFKQAGYSVEESLNLANSALVMKNVSENIESTAAAASDLIAVMKGFDLAVSDSMSIVDMINSVSNALPISFGAIDEGLTRISGTLAQTGTSIQETIGLITGGFASLRNVEKVSSGLIQISQRLRGIGESGETIDGLAPKLQSMFKEIAGIDIADTNGELRSTFDILSDLAKVADDLTSKERQLLFQEASGTRQVTVLNSIIQNWDDVSKAIDKATNSTGSAMRENEKFLDSIQGKTNRLASSFQMLANNTIESGAIKGLIDFANALVQVIDKIGPLQTALLAITGFTTLFSNGKLAGTVASLGKSFLNMGKTFLMLPKTIKQSNENFIGPLQAGTQVISKFRLAAFGAVAAVTLIKGAFDEYARSLEEQKRKSEELLSSWESTRETLASNKATVEELKSEFADLSNGVDNFGNNVSLTSDEFSRYHQITNQIAGMFPEMVSGYDKQGNAILTVKGNVEQLTAAYREQEQAARDAIILGADTVFGQSKRSVNDKSDIFGIAPTGALQQMAVIKELSDAIAEMRNNPKATDFALSSESAALQDVLDATGISLEGAGEYLRYSIPEGMSDDYSQKLQSLYRTLDKQSKDAAKNVTPIIDAYLKTDKSYESLGDDVKDMLVGVVGSLDYDYIFQHSNAGSFWESIKADLVNPLTSDKATLDSITDSISASDKFKSGKTSVDEYAKSIENLKIILANAGIKENISAPIVDMAEIDNVDALIENVKLKLQDEFDDNVGELTLNQLRLGGDLKIEDGTLLSWQEFLALINQASAVMSSLAIGERLSAIASAASVANSAFNEQGYSAAVTKEQYDELAKAGEEYVSVIDNTNGYLSINKQKLDALILSKRNEEKANIAIAKAAKLQEFEKNAEAMRMNALLLGTVTGMTDEYKQSVLDKNAALLSSQEAILAEVNNLDLQASALEYATSAYKRWLDAKNAPEAGDMYDELSNAWKAIDEGLETGKVGTEKYLSAANLLIPDSIDPKDKKAVAKYKKSVMKYFTEDEKGVNRFIDDLTKQGFLDEISDGRYVSNATTNVESIAKSLGLTTDAVEAMFLSLKDYGSTIELNDQTYKTAEASKELAKATKDVTDAQEALNKARSSGASKEEIASLEADYEAKKKEQERIASQSPVEIPVELTLEEQYAKKIADLETLILDAGNLKIPVELLLKAKEELETLQSQVNAEPPIGAKIEAEASGVEDAKNDIDVGAGSGAEYDASIGVTADQSNLITAGKDIDAVAEKERVAKIKIQTENDTQASQDITNAEISTAKQFFPKDDDWYGYLNRKVTDLESSGSEQTPEFVGELNAYKAALESLFSSGYTLKVEANTEPADTETKELVENIDGQTASINVDVVLPSQKAREDAKAIVAADLLTIQNQFTDDGWYDYLSNKVNELEDRKNNLEREGIQLSPEDNGELDAYKEKLYDLTLPKTMPIVADISGAVSSTNELEKNIEGRNPTMTVDVKYSDGSGGNFVPKVDTKYAKGTQKAKKGVALTGEKGVETVITKDGFYTVGHDGPELVNLRGGEEILNDKDTKKLFGGNSKRKSGQAFGPGTKNPLDAIKSLLTKTFTAVANTPFVKALGKAAEGAVKKYLNDKNGTGVTVDTGKPGGSGKKSGGGGSSSAPVEEVKEEIKTDFEDWIPRLLDNVRKQTDKLLASAEKKITYQSQNSEIDKAIANNTKLMNLNSQATTRYMKQANSVGLSSSLIKKVQDGSIDIALYDENTRKLIADYQKWYDLAQKTKDTITSLQEEQRKLAMSKLDNVQGYYENRIGLYGNRLDIANSTIELGQATGREIKRDDYKAMIGDVNAQLALLRQEKAEYERTFTELVASGVIKEGSNDWYQYTAKVDDMQKSILQASLSLDEFNDLADAIAVNNLNVAIKYLNTVQGTLESVQGLRQAQGKELTAVDYEHLISVGMQQVSTLEAQNIELLKQQEGLDVLSSAYQEIQDQIDGNLNGIWNIKTSQEGWNDAITDLNINAIKKSNDQYNRQLETMRAIEELEKAKQRRNLVYREGKGFVYEADQGALRDAQRTVDQINIDNLIASLEESKANDNVYDNTGNLLGKLFTGLDGVDFSGYLQSVGSGNETSALLANAIKSIDWNSIKTASGASTSVEFSGGINLYGVDNVQDLAKAINNRLGGYVTQGLYNND